MRRLHLPLALAVLSLFALGCMCGDLFGLKEKISEKVGNAAMEKAAELAIEAEGGDKADATVHFDLDGSGVSLDGLPDYLRYPNSRGKANLSALGNDGSAGGTFVLATTDDAQTVAQWYQNQLASWRRTAYAQTDDGLMLAFDGGVRQAVITVGRPEDEDETLITIMFTENGPSTQGAATGSAEGAAQGGNRPRPRPGPRPRRKPRR